MHGPFQPGLARSPEALNVTPSERSFATAPLRSATPQVNRVRPLVVETSLKRANASPPAAPSRYGGWAKSPSSAAVNTAPLAASIEPGASSRLAGRQPPTAISPSDPPCEIRHARPHGPRPNACQVGTRKSGFDHQSLRQFAYAEGVLIRHRREATRNASPDRGPRSGRRRERPSRAPSSPPRRRSSRRGPYG